MTNLRERTRGPFATALHDREQAFAELAANRPVRPVRLPDGTHAWLVLEHAAARAALADPRLVKTWPARSPSAALPRRMRRSATTC